MEPDYTTYSIDELRQAHATIDKSAMPDRFSALCEELSRREAEQAGNPDYSKGASKGYFYRCPSCEKKLGMFSKAMNKWARTKTCPYCDETFKTYLDIKSFLILILPLLLLNLLLVKPLFVAIGISSSIATGIMAGLITVLSLRTKKAE